MLQSGRGVGRAVVMSEADVGWSSESFNVPRVQSDHDGGRGEDRVGRSAMGRQDGWIGLGTGGFLVVRKMGFLMLDKGSGKSRWLAYEKEAPMPLPSGHPPPELLHGQASSPSHFRVDGREGKEPSRLPPASR